MKNAAIRVVENVNKPSKEKLYYCCNFHNCDFFQWVKVDKATWSPDGVPVTYPCGNNIEIWDDVSDFEEVGEEVMSKHATIGFEKGNYVHISWVICAMLLMALIMYLTRN
ncbi:hypothetical protein CDL12_03869 [Handroanthus impetiginosus]|uniref:Uncharacterized protein n=1 Tax=Handroanthus impetiginosus TaxID=429701 RepID=A0A2G9I0X6_9LAMI|nr:hypothetical protein CDL12_03869 [Handroanthus impetiginosus]